MHSEAIQWGGVSLSGFESNKELDLGGTSSRRHSFPMTDLVPFPLQHETPREAPRYWDRCFNTLIARLRDTSVPLVELCFCDTA